MRSWILPARFYLDRRMACTPSAAQIRNRSCCLPTRGGLEASTGAITTKSSLASMPGKASSVHIPDDREIVAPTDPLKILKKGMGQDLKTWVSERMFHEISIYLHLTNAKAHAFCQVDHPLTQKCWGVFFPTDSEWNLLQPCKLSSFLFTSVIPFMLTNQASTNRMSPGAMVASSTARPSGWRIARMTSWEGPTWPPMLPGFFHQIYLPIYSKLKANYFKPRKKSLKNFPLKN